MPAWGADLGGTGACCCLDTGTASKGYSGPCGGGVIINGGMAVTVFLGAELSGK